MVIDVLDGVVPRLRSIRRSRHLTLAGVVEATGPSSSTVSRVGPGGRGPAVALLLALPPTS